MERTRSRTLILMIDIKTRKAKTKSIMQRTETEIQFKDANRAYVNRLVSQGQQHRYAEETAVP